MEWKLRPGMTTLTWTSLNIDPFINHVHAGLKKLQELVCCINDIIENRIEKNLKIVSKTLLVDLPENVSFFYIGGRGHAAKSHYREIATFAGKEYGN